MAKRNKNDGRKAQQQKQTPKAEIELSDDEQLKEDEVETVLENAQVADTPAAGASGEKSGDEDPDGDSSEDAVEDSVVEDVEADTDENAPGGDVEANTDEAGDELDGEAEEQSGDAEESDADTEEAAEPIAFSSDFPPAHPLNRFARFVWLASEKEGALIPGGQLAHEAMTALHLSFINLTKLEPAEAQEAIRKIALNVAELRDTIFHPARINQHTPAYAVNTGNSEVGRELETIIAFLLDLTDEKLEGEARLHIDMKLIAQQIRPKFRDDLTKVFTAGLNL